MRRNFRINTIDRISRFGLVCLGLIVISCNQVHEESDTGTLNDNGYNEELATKLDADDYGMSRYVMAFLKSGPNRSQDSVEAAALQKAHLENITRLAKEGKLVMAGPFLDDGPIRGIYIFNVQSLEEARELTSTDPSVQAGRLEMELHPWYGSAALKEMGRIHEKVAKKGITD